MQRSLAGNCDKTTRRSDVRLFKSAKSAVWGRFDASDMEMPLGWQTAEACPTKLALGSSARTPCVRQYCSDGNDLEFSRTPYGTGIGDDHVRRWVGFRPAITLANGGVAVDARLRVITAEGTPVRAYSPTTRRQGGLPLLGRHIT